MGGRADAGTREEQARLWTPEQADQRIGSLKELLDQLKVWARRLTDVRAELSRLSAFWGPDLNAPDHPDQEIAARLGREQSNLSTRLEEAVAALLEEGIEVKDIGTGLVDFYGLVDGTVVFLCWKVGEPEVGYFHGLTAGFAGRQPLPSRVRSSGTPPR